MSNSNITKRPTLGIVVPCFNEESVLNETTNRLILILNQMSTLGLISDKSSIYYIDDGSTDKTWDVIENLSSKYIQVCAFKLSRNYGHQNALLCGLIYALGDILISVDADLQDDLSVIPQMVSHYLTGYDIVYGVRANRKSDSIFKRISAEMYYKIMLTMKVDIIFNHADYRLLSRRAINSLSEYTETNLFLRGIIRLIGYKSTIVEYDRSERFAGQSKYPLRKMLSFAWQGVTSLTTAPLRLITILGFIVSVISIGFAIWGLFTSLFTNKTLPGWASTVVPMYLLGGLQLLSLGVIGEYVAKIYIECKNRPKFHLEKSISSRFDN